MRFLDEITNGLRIANKMVAEESETSGDYAIRIKALQRLYNDVIGKVPQ